MKKFIMISVLATVTSLFVGGCFEEEIDPYDVAMCVGTSLEADCVVTFFSASGETYLSEQHHQICLDKPFMKISTDEPTGYAECKLDGTEFFFRVPTDGINQVICDAAFAKLMLTMMTLEENAWDSVNSSKEKVKLSGTDYKVMRLTTSAVYPASLNSHSTPWAEVTLYANTQKRIIDRVSVKNLRTGIKISAFGYNWHKLDDLNRRVPTKIDVYGTDNWSIDAKRIIQVHYLGLDTQENMAFPE